MFKIETEDGNGIWTDVRGNDGKRLIYEFKIQRASTLIARGEFQVACCRFPAEGDPYAIPIPDFVLQKIPLADE